LRQGLNQQSGDARRVGMSKEGIDSRQFLSAARVRHQPL
jgi:hypothetical protein